MNTLPGIPPTRRGFLMATFVALVLAGCATQKVDWAGRVGQYTYDQAVLEIGPPDKQATLGDGTVVAEWLTRRGYVHAAPTVVYSPWAYYGPYHPDYIETYAPDHFLRLTFGPDGQLRAWRKLAR